MRTNNRPTKHQHVQVNTRTSISDKDLADIESMRDIIKCLSIDVDSKSMVVQRRAGDSIKRDFPSDDILESMLSFIMLSTAADEYTDIRLKSLIECCVNMFSPRIKDLATRSRTDTAKHEVYVKLLADMFVLAARLDPVMIQVKGKIITDSIKNHIDIKLDEYKTIRR